jgi:hypothetical protein
LAEAATASWDVEKILIGALVGSILGSLITIAAQRFYLRHVLIQALRADALGAQRFARSHVEQFEGAVRAAKVVESSLSTDAAGRGITFAQLTALSEGWVITAPPADLLGHGQRFNRREADAVMKYLHTWNLLVGLEARYRSALDKFLAALPAKTDTDEPNVSPAVLQEYIVRVKETAAELAAKARLLAAQAVPLADGELKPMAESDEAAVEHPTEDKPQTANAG